jgi:hypothetical protein
MVREMSFGCDRLEFGAILGLELIFYLFSKSGLYMLPYFAVAVAILSFAATFYFWRRSEHIAAILMDGAKGYEELRQKNTRLENAVLTFEKQIAELKRKDEENRRHLTQQATQSARGEQAHLDHARNLERKLRNTEQQRDHMIEAHDALKAKYEDTAIKVEELSAAASSWASERAAIKKQIEDAGGKSLATLKAELLQERTTSEDLSRELRKFKSKDVINPREFDTLKRRASHYERLYSGMKGLRDMVDERNKNWEDALVKMARWILTSSSMAKPHDPILTAGIGPIVGEALERIGAKILDIDDHGEAEAERKQLSDLEFRAGAQSDSTDHLPV